MSFYGDKNDRPPRGRNPIVYIIIALIGVLIAMANEPIACIFVIIEWHLAWITS